MASGSTVLSEAIMSFRAQIGAKTWRLTIPYNKPIKIIYVKQTLEAVEQVIEAREADDESNE